MTLFQDLLSYKALLESFGARVSLFQSVELPCVLTSQLVRLLAFQKEFVDEEDVIMEIAPVNEGHICDSGSVEKNVLVENVQDVLPAS